VPTMILRMLVSYCGFDGTRTSRYTAPTARDNFCAIEGTRKIRPAFGVFGPDGRAPAAETGTFGTFRWPHQKINPDIWVNAESTTAFVKGFVP
jgi:hypothetical protein